MKQAARESALYPPQRRQGGGQRRPIVKTSSQPVFEGLENPKNSGRNLFETDPDFKGFIRSQKRNPAQNESRGTPLEQLTPIHVEDSARSPTDSPFHRIQPRIKANVYETNKTLKRELQEKESEIEELGRRLDEVLARKMTVTTASHEMIERYQVENERLETKAEEFVS